MQRLDCLVVGAGVVGLACALALAECGQEVWVVEAQARAGEGVSSRNSGVIHAGLYYPPGSLKARHCVRGRELLYAFCRRHRLNHSQPGKWVVATDEADLPALRALQQRAEANGLAPLAWVEAAELAQREPALRAVAALDVPQTGLVDVPQLIEALAAQLQARGGGVLAHTEVQRIEVETEGFAVFAGDDEPLHCRCLINAAGLGAQTLAGRIGGFPAALIPALHYASGHYYRLRGAAPFRRLVYPLPGLSGLGIHLGYDPEGRARFGPDVRFIDQPDYRFDDSQRESFAAAIRDWWPALRSDQLLADFVGVRPKLSGPGEPSADFVLQGPARHGIAGLLNLFGIESPGLTSALSIGKAVAEWVALGPEGGEPL